MQRKQETKHKHFTRFAAWVLILFGDDIDHIDNE